MHQIEGAVTPDESSIAQLYQEHAQMVLSYIRSRVSSKEDAEDLLVEVFMAALHKPIVMHLNPGEQQAWLRRVAHNKIIDHYRRVVRFPAMLSLDEVVETALDDEDCAPEQLALHHEAQRQLWTRLSTLSELQQEVLQLRFAHDLATKEIAERLSKSDTAIRSILSRTLNLLRTIYHPSKEEMPYDE